MITWGKKSKDPGTLDALESFFFFFEEGREVELSRNNQAVTCYML